MQIVLGLGNPGSRYRATRHNLGFRVLDRIAEREGLRFRSAGELGRKALTAEVQTPTGPVILGKPRTYMNRSGRAAAAVLRELAATHPSFWWFTTTPIWNLVVSAYEVKEAPAVTTGYAR